jgi:hypothetical protein
MATSSRPVRAHNEASVLSNLDKSPDISAPHSLLSLGQHIGGRASFGAFSGGNAVEFTGPRGPAG